MPLKTCKERDPKGLYARVGRGEIKQFTGIDSPYEAPEAPEVRIRAGEISVAEAVNQLLAYLNDAQVLGAGYEPVVLNNP